MTARSFVDSNVLIYLHEGGRKGRRAAEVMSALLSSNAVVVSPQVIGEVFVNVERAFGREVATSQCADLTDAAFVQPLDRDTTESTRSIVERYGLSYWDAQVCAAALAAGTSVLLSEDLQDGQTIEGVRVRNPFARDFRPEELA